jgi:surface antigen
MFPLSDGQCVDWAYLKRPDIYDERFSADPNTNWDADTWAGHAEAEGLAVDGSPRVGDIAVWPQSYGSPGAVAYVEAVEGNGASISVSAMDVSGAPSEDDAWDGPYEYYVFSITEPATMGLRFIHQR